MAETVEWVMLVEVEKEQRVRCDYLDCHHSIYRRIHILKYPDGRYQCIGSGCFKKLSTDTNIHVTKAASVQYFNQGKTLSQLERQQLIDNRSVLLEKLLTEGLQQQQAIAAIKLNDPVDVLPVKTIEEVIDCNAAPRPILKPVNISQASPVENYHLLRNYKKFNPRVNYAAFPQGEKYSRALDMVQRKYRQPGLPVDTGSVEFQREVQALIDDMVDYRDEQP